MVVTAGITIAEGETPYGSPNLTFSCATVNAEATISIVENMLQLPGQRALAVPRFIVDFESLCINGSELTGVHAVYAPCVPRVGTVTLHMPTTAGTHAIGYHPLIIDPEAIEPDEAATALELLHLAAQRCFTFTAVKALATERLTREIQTARRNVTAQEIALARLETSQPHTEPSL